MGCAFDFNELIHIISTLLEAFYIYILERFEKGMSAFGIFHFLELVTASILAIVSDLI